MSFDTFQASRTQQETRMRAHKLISLCFVILLITVLFTGVASISVAAQSAPLVAARGDPANNTANVPVIKNNNATPTEVAQEGPSYSRAALTTTRSVLNATAPSTAYVAHNFVVKGRLTASGVSLTAQRITLQRSANNVTWASLATTATSTTGWYSFSRNESAAGTYYYRTTYAGTATHTNATSNVVRVAVVKMPTQLSLAVSPASPIANTRISFSGKLKTSATTPVPLTSSKVYLLVSPDTTHWSLISSPSSTATNASGTYLFSKYLSARTLYCRARYDGTTLYKAALSPIMKVVVNAQATQRIAYIPQSGATWVNHGTAGTSYNAYVSTPGLYRTQANGYPYWGAMGRNDFIFTPAGSATNNQNVVSWEIGFKFNGLSGQRFQKIWDKAYGAFMLEIDTYKGASESYLTIYRATTSGSGARWYIPTDTVLRAGHNYYLQIAWDTRAGPGHEPYPTVWIAEDGKAPVHQTHWDESGGALGGTGSWYNDAVGSVNLGNTASDGTSITSVKTAWLNGGFYVYRQYNAIINFSGGGSWNTDKLAWTA